MNNQDKRLLAMSEKLAEEILKLTDRYISEHNAPSQVGTVAIATALGCYTAVVGNTIENACTVAYGVFNQTLFGAKLLQTMSDNELSEVITAYLKQHPDSDPTEALSALKRIREKNKIVSFSEESNLMGSDKKVN